MDVAAILLGMGIEPASKKKKGGAAAQPVPPSARGVPGVPAPPAPTREERSQAATLVRMGSGGHVPTAPAKSAPGPADPSVAASRFDLDRLGQSAGSKLPCPVLTWVAAIIHTIAEDTEISGGDDSLTGLTKTAVFLEGGEGKDVGLQLRFKSLKGPQGDLICRIARKVMEIMGKKDRLRGDMFSDWEALRKHLCEDKGLDLGPGPAKKLPHFSFLWTGLKRGGNQSRDFSQTYFERRYTANLAEMTLDGRKHDRKIGGKHTHNFHHTLMTRDTSERLLASAGGGNPGLMSHCAILLKRDFPGLYDKAKTQALADVANGFQSTTFRKMADAAAKALTDAQQQVPTLPKKQLTKKVAEERNASKHAVEADTPHPHLHTWKTANPKPVVRSWLAVYGGFTTVQVDRTEDMFETQERVFDLVTVGTRADALGGIEALKKLVTTEAEASAAQIQKSSVPAIRAPMPPPQRNAPATGAVRTHALPP